MIYPLDLCRWVKFPNRELIEVLLVQRDETQSVNFPKICEVLKKFNIKVILQISYYMNNLPHILCFLDITDLNLPFENVIKEFEKENLRIIEIAKPKRKGIIIDTISFPLMAGRSRVIIFRDFAYSNIIKGLRERFGSGGEVLLYYIGLECGRGFGKLHKEFAQDVEIEDPAEIYREISCAFFQWAGFGRIADVEITEEGGSITLHDSFECEIMRNKLRKSYSQLVRGMITGILNEVFNKEFDVIEERCLAKGDPFCRFKISSRYR
ncbi:MAG: hypothetical protein NZ922_03965 [Candidatus Methanomethyliaceae archaeon]|nr:hypothetical protein [Candidatus Methanomethyliaceae archaeon]MDW7971568.1 hypothetical protein [Nitrososphaerota archaeon]